jgi:hypothetical protein
MDQSAAIEKFHSELTMAEAARASGNEGRARVCARRAAGIVVGQYLEDNGISAKPSAYDRLRTLQGLPGTPADVLQVLDHLLLRVKPDQQLPIIVDLIKEARWLKRKLLD